MTNQNSGSVRRLHSRNNWHAKTDLERAGSPRDVCPAFCALFAVQNRKCDADGGEGTLRRKKVARDGEKSAEENVIEFGHVSKCLENAPFIKRGLFVDTIFSQNK